MAEACSSAPNSPRTGASGSPTATRRSGPSSPSPTLPEGRPTDRAGLATWSPGRVARALAGVHAPGHKQARGADPAVRRVLGDAVFHGDVPARGGRDDCRTRAVQRADWPRPLLSVTLMDPP
ncbi:hypothetical protein EAO71_22775 [Streptomyces sp. ms191]|nr:hypothetical protein EAO71_22775 [Streptomyces sp. ms191]